MDFQRLIDSIEEIKAKARAGLPAEPERPAPFVDIPLSIVIAERLRPFIRIAVKYLAILAEGTVYRIDTDKLAQYREYAELLAHSTGSNCSLAAAGVRGLLRIMDDMNAQADVTEADISRAIRASTLYIRFARFNTSSDMSPQDTDYLTRERMIAEHRAEVARLRSDSAAFQGAYDEVCTKYDEIKRGDTHE
ncbi:hypothetical protein ACX93W_12565 [Paenibacillus sp. CAU 1782]